LDRQRRELGSTRLASEDLRDEHTRSGLAHHPRKLDGAGPGREWCSVLADTGTFTIIRRRPGQPPVAALELPDISVLLASTARTERHAREASGHEHYKPDRPLLLHDFDIAPLAEERGSEFVHPVARIIGPFGPNELLHPRENGIPGCRDSRAEPLTTPN